MMTADEIRANRARWLANAKQQLVETKEEIALFEQGDCVWERKFKLDFPGNGYAAAMRAQAARLELEIARHEQADREVALRSNLHVTESTQKELDRADRPDPS